MNMSNRSHKLRYRPLLTLWSPSATSQSLYFQISHFVNSIILVWSGRSFAFPALLSSCCIRNFSPRCIHKITYTKTLLYIPKYRTSRALFPSFHWRTF
ncbi:exported hypothetical protein [Xenorhabdus nematophila str. Websteri]|nr:exported hypothetical protein [Xenorhabdus nematophila str. Websteri]